MLILAEIADKMPALETVWQRWLLVGFLVTIFTLVSCSFRLWIGALIVLIAGSIVLAALPDSVMDPYIARELGEGYLWQTRGAAFIPFGLALITWGAAAGVRRHRAKRVSR